MNRMSYCSLTTYMFWTWHMSKASTIFEHLMIASRFASFISSINFIPDQLIQMQQGGSHGQRKDLFWPFMYIVIAWGCLWGVGTGACSLQTLFYRRRKVYINKMALSWNTPLSSTGCFGREKYPIMCVSFMKWGGGGGEFGEDANKITFWA